jgi:hypothetical protein
MSSAGGGFFQRLKTLVSDSSSVVASGTNSLIANGASRFVTGTIPPIPTSKAVFAPANDQVVQKCRLVEVMGRPPQSDIEAHALVVVGTDYVKCFAAPLDMTVLTSKCELRSYGSWKIADVCKITSKNGQPDTIMLYFSVESAPDLVVTLINSGAAKTLVEDIRRKFRATKKSPS